ncbi:MAG: nitrate/nitrite transport system ATP-binding protein [Rhodospirillaceae bacterium]|nr:MAG: nitrate/nitrite transport system ATP-binding protein [Rhodospirillaceae bacterium]
MLWLTAVQNVALGVDRVYPHAIPAERSNIVAYYLERVGLAEARDKKASELSNGMKQRVGIARAFALSPKLLPLDEAVWHARLPHPLGVAGSADGSLDPHASHGHLCHP